MAGDRLGHRLNHQLWTWARPILVGWATLVPLGYMAERLLLPWTARLLGPGWLPTAQVSLDCLVLAAAGWAIARLHPSAPVSGALIFAATLCFRDLDPLVALNIPWLLRLAADAFRDSRYLGSLGDTAAQHLFLLGSLIAGALLGRPARKPVSLLGGTLLAQICASRLCGLSGPQSRP
jgi:hypothetical protein